LYCTLWAPGHRAYRISMEYRSPMKHQHDQTDADTGAERSPHDRLLRIGIGGPVGSGKTALVLRLCQQLWPAVSLGVVTNDIFTREDALFLTRQDALPTDRIIGLETGGCPHAA